MMRALVGNFLRFLILSDKHVKSLLLTSFSLAPRYAKQHKTTLALLSSFNVLILFGHLEESF